MVENLYAILSSSILNIRMLQGSFISINQITSTLLVCVGDCDGHFSQFVDILCSIDRSVMNEMVVSSVTAVCSSHVPL